MNKDDSFPYNVQELCKFCYIKNKFSQFDNDKCSHCHIRKANPVYVDPKNKSEFVRDFRNCGLTNSGTTLKLCEHPDVTNRYEHGTTNRSCTFAINDFEFQIWNTMKSIKIYNMAEIFKKFVAPFIFTLRTPVQIRKAMPVVPAALNQHPHVKCVPNTLEMNTVLQSDEKRKDSFCWFCLNYVKSEAEVLVHVSGKDHNRFYKADKNRRWYYKMPRSKSVAICKSDTCDCTSPHNNDECLEMKARLKFRTFKFNRTDPMEKKIDPWPIDVESSMPRFPNNIDCYKKPMRIAVKLILKEWRINYICMVGDESRLFFKIYNNSNNQKGPILRYESDSEQQSPDFRFDVEFEPICSGTYIQIIEFEFQRKGKQYYCQKSIRVDVGTSKHLEGLSNTWQKYKTLLKRNLNFDQISSLSNEENGILSESLLRRVFRVVSNLDWLNVRVEPWNYCDWMMDMLVHEELEQQLILSQLVFTGDIKMVDSFTKDVFIKSPVGRLFGTIVFKKEKIHSREYIVKHINKAFISFNTKDGVIYECDLVDSYFFGVESRSIKEVTICISDLAVKDLHLTAGMICQDASVYFRFNRIAFERRHKSLENMPHYDSLSYKPLCCPSVTHLPFGSDQSTVSFKPKLTLNLEQQQLPLLVLRSINIDEIILPFILSGAFGTGKSSIIAETVGTIIRDVSRTARVLICTRSSSAGMVYLKMFQNLLTETMMEKIKMIKTFNKDMDFQFNKFLTNSNSLTVEMYEENRVFIKTIDGVSSAMSEIKNHIADGNPMFEYLFVDEASQVLEVDAIAVYQFGNKKSKFTFAGDVFQLKPDYYNKDLKKFVVPIVSRLYGFYIQQECPDYMICLKQVYRAHPMLVQYLSETIYVDCGLTSETIPKYPNMKPTKFIDSNANGENRMEYDDRYCSFSNDLEAEMIVHGIRALLDPSKTTSISEEQILVCTPFYSQVKLIRSKLKKEKLKNLKIELPSNIQGAEYDALFISTVITVNNEREIPIPTFHSSKALINMVISRARHYVEVVGDKECLLQSLREKEWRKFIDLC